MEQEHKELLLKDLCGRLPYGVKCENFNHVYGKNIFKVTDIRCNGYICGVINNQYCWSVFDPFELKPYLFPLSSMKEEQREEIEDKLTFPNNSDGGWIEILYNNKYEIPFWFVDFCNKNHIDYRGLIPMGLAIDATGLNIYENVY